MGVWNSTSPSPVRELVGWGKRTLKRGESCCTSCRILFYSNPLYWDTDVLRMMPSSDKNRCTCRKHSTSSKEDRWVIPFINDILCVVTACRWTLKYIPDDNFFRLLLFSKFHLQNLFKPLTQLGWKQVTFNHLTLAGHKNRKLYALFKNLFWYIGIWHKEDVCHFDWDVQTTRIMSKTLQSWWCPSNLNH